LATTLAVALLCSYVEPIPCAAQAPAPSAVRRAPASPPADPRGEQDVRQLPPALPGPPPAGVGPASPLATIPTLRAAPFAPGDVRFPINLATALRLSDARPLVVAAAQARTWVAEAELTRAKVLWLPDFNLGFDYIRHDGGGPD